MLHKTVIGADPEAFIYDLSTGKYVPAIGRIGGTKDRPLPISQEGHYIQEDNVMVEFNIPARETASETFDDITKVLKYIQENKLKDDEIIKSKSSAEFSEEELRHPQAAQFGCDPDYNVWTECVNDPPLPEQTHRYAGGHIHIASNVDEVARLMDIVKGMDLFFLVPSVLIDDDTKRREVYGTPGNFRLKSYGLEYRSSSNFWITNKEYVELVHLSVERVIEFLNNGGDPDKEKDSIHDTILNSDKSKAKKLIKKYNIKI